MKVKHGQPSWVAWIAGVADVRRDRRPRPPAGHAPARRASPLARIVATLGMLIVLQAAAVLRYGARVTAVRSELPGARVLHPFGETVSVDRFILLGIAAALTRRAVGVLQATRSSAWPPRRWPRTSVRRPRVGLSPDWVATANWALGSALAGMAAILIAPIVQLQVATMTNLVLAALAAALVAGFRSFPIAFVAGMRHRRRPDRARPATCTRPASPQSLPFIVIVVWMVVRGQALPLRDYFLQRLPGRRQRHGAAARRRSSPLVVTGRGHPVGAAASWQDAFVTTFAIGHHPAVGGGHHRLRRPAVARQFAIAGFGALVAGRLVDAAGWPFPLALLAAGVATVPLGAIFALPAVRARGINLAIVTLGLGTAIELMIFNNGDFVGGFAGTVSRQADAVRLGHQRHRPPRPLRHRVHVLLRAAWR